MLSVIQQIYARYKVWRFCSLKSFGEAIIIIRYASRTGRFPCGDEEYERILNSETL